MEEKPRAKSDFLMTYSKFAKKGEKNGIKFVKMHKNHFQNRIQVL